ncbi:MAG: hypothetical protein ACXQTJ_04685, partial [Candidatus Syntropharchaeales archaeon]
RRLLEAYERDLWDPDPEVLNELKRYYLEIEGWIEGRMGGVSGVQGGSIDVFTMEEVEEWRERMEKVKRYEEEV